MSGWDDPESDEADGWGGPDADGAPICPACGVTALPTERAAGADVTFVCENPDCEMFGERV